MSYPNWVLKHKEKNTEIKFISNKYYLYKITSKWDPIKKRTKKITLGLIGSITQNGIIYTADRKKRREEKNAAAAGFIKRMLEKIWNIKRCVCAARKS